MLISRTRKSLLQSSALGVIATAAMLSAGGAMAQAAPLKDPPAKDADQVSEVVVTGTLLRGIAPTGTDVISVDQQKVLASGAASSNDLLATIPQISLFGTEPRGNQDAGSPLVKPNLRNLGASGGNTTLVLLDGHRLVGQGVFSTYADPSIIPPGVIDRIEVIPDGGSSIYGSDAIGGVINFITRRHFEGVEATGRYGFADNYRTWDVNLTAGHGWDGGSIVLSYAHAWHDDLLGANRDYATANHTARGGQDLRNTNCSPANITVAGVTYALPGRVAGTVNRCDDAKATDIYPRETRDSVFGTVIQNLTPKIELSTSAYWSVRKTQILTAQSAQSGTITAANPYFSPIGAEAAQTVGFSFASVFGPSNISNHRFVSYGVTPSLKADLDGNWQLRGMVNYGRSVNTVHEDLVNASAAAVALGGTTTATALNPYNLSATNPAVLANIENFENLSQATQRLTEVRGVLDGSLFTLPGGQVRLAVGAEYHYENLWQRFISGPRGAPGGSSGTTSRDSRSLFAEVLVPIVGDANGRLGLRSLVLSASARTDHYSDVGGTTNPKVGLNYKPFDDFTIRADWGTSFHAPSLADTASTVGGQVQILPISPYRPVTSPFTDLFRPTIVIAGGNPNLRPETAHTWSVGADWKPHYIEGLKVSATYYNIDFTDAIGLVNPATLFTDPNFAPFFTINPTLAQAQAAAGNRPIIGAPSIAALYAGPVTPFLVVDARLNNFGSIKTDGIDFDVSYTHPVGSAVLMGEFAGTYTLDRNLASGKNGPYTNTLANGTGRIFYVMTLGAKSGPFIAQAKLNYRGGYPILGVVGQTKVSAFKTVDLFLGYQLPDHGWTSHSMLTLNIDNVLDQAPPYFNSTTGYANGSTLGRLVEFGVRKTF